MAVAGRHSLRTFEPLWPNRAEVNPDQIAYSYDRLSDTLFVDFEGRPRPAVSVPLARRDDLIDVYLRVDPVTESVLGLQIEGVLGAFDRQRWLRGALALAELRGIERRAILDLPRAVDVDRRSVVDAIFDALAPSAA